MIKKPGLFITQVFYNLNKYILNIRENIMNTENLREDMEVELLIPYRGYRWGKLVCFFDNKWLVKLSSGLEIRLFADEFKVI